MQKLEIVLGLIEQDDEYILQLRDMNDPNAITAGLIGCFGGKQQPDETPQAAVARELSEETSLTARPDEWQWLGKVEVSSEYLLEPVTFLATAYRYVLQAGDDIQAKEGGIVRLQRTAVAAHEDRLTPATKVVFHELLRLI